jgi:hypothetical protein
MMSSLLERCAAAFAAAGVLIGCSSAGAAILYNNGFLNGTVDAFEIAGGAGVADSFTLSSAATISGIDFGVWTFPGDTLSSVEWAIHSYTTDPTVDLFSGFLASGTAAVTNGSATLRTVGTTTFAMSTDSISLTGGLSLPAGSYYLILESASVPNHDPVFWDESDGLSSAFSSVIGTLQGYSGAGLSGSESFDIRGSFASSAPEPTTWILMLLGFAGLGGVRRRGRALRSA